MDFNSIDWNAMWQEETGRGHWKDNMSQRELWDKRAHSFDKSVNPVKQTKKRDKEDYISKMLDRIDVQPGWTVLDIGSGPGTLSLPLMEMGAQVTALDISPKMLERLRHNAAEKNLENLSCINGPWQEKLADVPRHDVVVASRSLMAGDMRYALECIAALAERAAYLTFPVVHLPFDWEVYRAIGRGQKKHAPYIYIANMLYQMGIHADVEIIYSRVRVRFTSIEDVVSSLQWRTDPFTPEELDALRAYLEPEFAAAPDSVLTHEGFSRWALISWKNRL